MGYEQYTLALEEPLEEVAIPATINLLEFDRFLVFFSGGKDSVACVLHLLELGVERDRIELHHHLVDGREGSNLMDWPVTEAYCNAFARALGIKITFSWKQGGMEREMLRNGVSTAPTMVPVGDRIVAIGGKGPSGTREKFPQLSASLTTRWCSSYLKIMPGSAYLVNDPKFLIGKTLVVTGERAEESPARAKYAVFEPHRTDNREGAKVKRWVDHWRPVHGWTDKDVWAVIERWRIAPHPCYLLGWGRASCQKCVYGSPSQWASIRVISPNGFQQIANYEKTFNVTIHRTRSVEEQAARGIPYAMDPKHIALAMGTEYKEPIILDHWTLPAGAFGEACGPT